MRKFLATVAITGIVLLAKADAGHDLWLRPHPANKVNISCDKNSPTIEIAKQELIAGWLGASNASVTLLIKKDKAIVGDGYRLNSNSVEAHTDLGLLYGVYDLLRRQQAGESIGNAVSNPSYQNRILNHWDNPDGSIERGYAGKSIFWRKDDPFTVTDNDKKLWREYARANASIGINASVLDNVNASPMMLTAVYLNRVKAIAEVFRPYGIRTYHSVKFSSPKQIADLPPMIRSILQWLPGGSKR